MRIGGKHYTQYVAPPAERVEQAMRAWQEWLLQPLLVPPTAATADKAPFDQELLAPVKAAVAHLWFECMHPFADGNGRTGRAFAERVLRGAASGATYLATAIAVRDEGYYEKLGKYGKDAQGNDITDWVDWFIRVCELAQDWEWERLLFERDLDAFRGGPAKGLSPHALHAVNEILDDWPGGRCMTGVTDAEWRALLDGAPPPGEALPALVERGVFGPGDEGCSNLHRHFRDVGMRLYEVGVHWVPLSCEPAAPSP